MSESNDGNVDIGAILDIDDARVGELIHMCYEHMDKLKQENSSQPADDMIHFMADIGKNEHEIFLAGFILSSVYHQNMDDIQKADVQHSVGSMFG